MLVEYEYEPAPLAARRRLTIEPELARLLDEAGVECAHVRFAEVDGVRYVETSAQGMVVRRLELRCGEQLFRLPVNVASGADAGQPPLSTFYEAGAALLGALARQRPELELELGEGRGMRAAWFGIGLLTLLMGVGIPLAALATGVSSDKLVGGALPLLLLTLLGVVLVRGNRPWKPLPRVSLAHMVQALGALRSRGDAG